MPTIDCPFQAVEKELARIKNQAGTILVDMHCEATSEKIAMGWFLDGKVSAVLGTHTHVTTADERVLPGGTAYITDIGMCGPFDSIIGIEKQSSLSRFLTAMPAKFETAKADSQMNAVLIDIDDDTGEYKPDNWLVARKWFDKAEELVAQGGGNVVTLNGREMA